MRQRLTETSGDDGQPLDVNGRRLIDCHEQIVGILRNRLGRNHADLFAQPSSNEASRSITWFTELTGSVTPAAALPADEQQRLKQRAERIFSDIHGLAEQMHSEGPTGHIVGQMLLGAAQLPAGPCLFDVGGKPVVVLWGHRSGSSSTGVSKAPAVALASGLPAEAAGAARSMGGSQTPPRPDEGVAMGAAVQPGAPGGALAAEIPVGSKPRSEIEWKRWLLPGLLALLLLGTLLWGLKSCSPGPGSSELPGSDLDATIAEAEGRIRALETEIARRNSKPARLNCVPEPLPPAAPPSKEPPQPQSEAPPSPETADPSPRVAQPKKPEKKVPEPPPPRLAEVAPAPPAAPPAVPAATPKPPPPLRSACKRAQPGDEPEVVVIVDASGSMRESFAGGASRMDAAKRGADSMIRSLPPEVDVALVDFAACGQVRRDKFYSAGQRGALIGEINALQPRAGTPLADAIQRAGAISSDTAASVMVIVSDGGDSCGGDPCAVARTIKAKKPNVTINVIDVSQSARERQVLQCIASAGGGRVLSPGDSVDMTRKMKEAAGAANCA